MELDIPRLEWSYDDLEQCAKVTQGSTLIARVYGETREEAAGIARLQAATPLLIHVLMMLRDDLPWHRIHPAARQVIEVALDYAFTVPERSEWGSS